MEVLFLMKTLKRIITIMLVVTIIATICVFSTVSSSAQGTGVGLSEWAMNAYVSGWSYVYGGCSEGAVDCSGLIYSYVQCERCGDPQLDASPESGSLSSLPNIHGLGLWQPGHVGIYIGSGMAIDARNESAGVCLDSVYSHGWYYWFKVNGVSYPSTGWEECNGDYFYYENGEYITDTTRTIDGTTYYFGSDGASSTTPEDVSLQADYEANSKASSSSSSSSSLRRGSTGDRVIDLQERLAELGYYSGPIDGDFGSGTEQAFKDFQTAAGLTPDGIAGSDVDYLYADDAPALSGAGNDTADYEETETETENAEAVETEDTEEVEEVEEIEETEEIGFSGFKKGDYSDEVANLQERLFALGYFNGDIDGSFGSNTESAVKAFQEANDLEATGIVDEDTYNLLFSSDAQFAETEEETEAAQSTASNPLTKNSDKAAIKSSQLKANKEKLEAQKKASTKEPSTEIELKTNELSSKALSGLANKLSDKNNNFGFLFWLLVVIAVLSIALVVVYIIERKRTKKAAAKHSSRRFK